MAKSNPTQGPEIFTACDNEMYAEAVETLEIPDQLQRNAQNGYHNRRAEEEDAPPELGCSAATSREDDIVDELDDEVAMELDPPPRALVSAQMEFLIASAAVGERASEFSDAGDALASSSLRAWRVDDVDTKLRPAKVEEVGETTACFVLLDARAIEAVDVYYWIGAHAPIGSIAIVAFKSVELTNLCRELGASVRCGCRREVEGKESVEFRALLLRELPASSSGLDEANDEQRSKRKPKRMFPARSGLSSTSMRPSRGDSMGSGDLVPGRRFPRRLFRVGVHANQVRKFVQRGARLEDIEPRRSSLGLNAARDVIVVDSGVERLFVWYGALSTLALRAVGLEAAMVLRRERVELLGSCDAVVVAHQGSEPDELWDAIGQRDDIDNMGLAAQPRLRRQYSPAIRSLDYDDDCGILSKRGAALLHGGCASVWHARNSDADALAAKACNSIARSVEDELLEDAIAVCAGLVFPSISTTEEARWIVDRPRGAPVLPIEPWWRMTTPPSSFAIHSPKSEDGAPFLFIQKLLALPSGKRGPSNSRTASRQLGSHFARHAATGGDDWRTCKPRLVVVAWHRGELIFVDIPVLRLVKKNPDGTTRPTLRSSATAVLDAGGAVYVWRGKNSGGACRDAARLLASKIATCHPSWCRTYELFEGSEPLAFRSNFEDWTDAEVAKAKKVAQDTFSRDYSLRRSSTGIFSPRASARLAPPPWGQNLAAAKRNRPLLSENQAAGRRTTGEDDYVDVARATNKLLARQRDVFAAVASMLRQSWSSSYASEIAADRPPKQPRHAAQSGADINAAYQPEQRRILPITRRELRARRRRREYLCGDAGHDEEGDDDDDAHERRSRERRRLSPDGESLSDSGEHHVVAWSLEAGKLVRLDDEIVGNFESTKSYAILYGATVDTVAAHDVRTTMRENDADTIDEAFLQAFTLKEDVQTPHGSAADILSLRHSLRPANRPRQDARFILIFWEGESAPREDRSRWLLELRPWLLQDWAQELAVGAPTEHMRVRQRRESRLFLQIANRAMGGYVVHISEKPQTTCLFHVRGDSLASAIEVAPQASSLCSADVFIAARREYCTDVLQDPVGYFDSETASKARLLDAALAADSNDAQEAEDWTVWVWVGSGSNARCRRLTATLVCKVMDFFGIDGERTKVRVLDESGDDGSERRRSFWLALGGPRPYADHPLLRVPPGQRSSVARAPLFFVVAENKRAAPSNGTLLPMAHPCPPDQMPRHHISIYKSSPPNSYVNLDEALLLEQSDPSVQTANSSVKAVLHTTVEQHRLLDDERAIVVDAHFSVLVWLGRNARRRDAALAKRVASSHQCPAASFFCCS